MQTIKQKLIALGFCLAFSGFVFLASPLAALSTGTGSIQGRIQNSATGAYLNNARVTVEGTNRSVLTNEFGEYRFANVPPGENRVTVFYNGLPPQTETVNVPSGQTAVKDFDLKTMVAAGGLVKLGAFTVSASRGWLLGGPRQLRQHPRHAVLHDDCDIKRQPGRERDQQ